MKRSDALPLSCLAAIVAAFIWSAVNPFERHTWWMEVAPVLIVLPLMAATYRSFRLTDLLYFLIAIHAVILMVGAHYSYARVPLFDFGADTRNNFDKLGHFAQGFVPAIVIRELLVRTSTLTRGKWMAAAIIFSCLGISAVYELIEWGAAMALGQGADEFLGTQGDPWDTQKDMACAGIGAIAALLTLRRLHDRGLERLTPSSRR